MNFKGISKSNEYKLQAKKIIPAISQTFSKSPFSFVEGLYPVYVKSAYNSHIVDVDNNDFIDYLMALGPVVLGYNNKSVNDAISNQLKNGISFSLPHTKEIEAAEALKRIIPCAEMTRFTKTGSDAVTGAVRAARAITKKDIILYCGSGGVWDDWFAIVTSRNQGIPSFNKDLIKIFDYNKIDQLYDLFKKNKEKVAAVIMEPAVHDLPNNNFLQEVKKITHDNNALLIFDEILTGFRISNGGGQEFFNVIPDMATFAKGIANGMPLGAIVGKEEHMKIFEKVFVSTTYGGESLSLAACIATINEFERNNVCDHMWKIGDKIKEGFNKISKEKELNAECVGLSPRLQLKINDENNNDSLLYKSLFLQELLKKGIFMHPNTILFSYAHTLEEIEYTIEEFDNALSILKKAIVKNDVKNQIQGIPCQEIIRRL
jgi:glutamate-1-semialdehyde 2,1-aminomutase